jgi:hypothetical protein
MSGLGDALTGYGGKQLLPNVPTTEFGPWPPQSPTDDAGRALSSWRLQLAPYFLVAVFPYPDLDTTASWETPVNLAFVRELGQFYTFESPAENANTHVFGITGKDTAFDADAVSHYADLPSDVIVAMEIRDSNTRCMQPGDYDVTELLEYTGRIGDNLQGLLPDRLHVLFADGEVWALSLDAPMSALQPFLTIAGANANDREELLAPHCIAKTLPHSRSFGQR